MSVPFYSHFLQSQTTVTTAAILPLFTIFRPQDVSGSSGESAVLLAASRGNWNEVIRFLERGTTAGFP